MWTFSERVGSLLASTVGRKEDPSMLSTASCNSFQYGWSWFKDDNAMSAIVGAMSIFKTMADEVASAETPGPVTMKGTRISFS